MMLVYGRWRRLVAFISVLSFIILSSNLLASEMSPAKPVDLAYKGSQVRKLQRGFLNIVLSPIEISHELDNVKNYKIIAENH